MRNPLVFTDHALEQTFREQHARGGLAAVRRGLASAAIGFGALGLLDWLVAPGDVLLLWSLRALVVLPLAAALLYSALRTKRFLGQQQQIAASATLLGGLGVLAMLTLAGEPIPTLYPAMLIPVLLWGFFGARVRFEAAAAVGATLVVAYAAAALLLRPIEIAWALTYIALLGAVLVLSGMAALGIERLERERFLDRRTIEDLSVRDPLTGLFNRRHLEERIGELAAIRRRYGAAGCLVLIDLDGFGAINDLFGDWVGDRVLQEVARLLVSNARVTDLVFRYGADEFCLLLPNTDPAAAVAMLERVRVGLRAQPVGEGAGARVVQMSAVCLAIPDHDAQPGRLVAQAEGLLQEAKRRGHGRILLPDDEEDETESMRHPSRPG
jgi:diguanylate cyclase (GGDEF)-like protein